MEKFTNNSLKIHLKFTEIHHQKVVNGYSSNTNKKITENSPEIHLKFTKNSPQNSPKIHSKFTWKFTTVLLRTRAG